MSQHAGDEECVPAGAGLIIKHNMMYWADRTIKWEREQMIPAITNSDNSAERNTEALGRIERVLVRLDDRAETPPPHSTN